MPNHEGGAKNAYVTRDRIMNRLSAEEIAKVSTAESRPLVEGDDYIDLEHPERGVLQAHAGGAPPPGTLLPRSAVRDETWDAIVAMVAR